jgi:ubiquinone/menaquinone biosynthesis C-methylase UbiE
VGSNEETRGISECFDKCACVRGQRTRPGSIRGASRVLLDLLDHGELVGRTVLELGCGLGGLTLATLSQGAAHATGIDLSPVAIREASRLAQESGFGEQVSFAVGDAARVQLSTSDVVILDKVICCYPQVDALLENSLRATSSTYAFVLPFSVGVRGILARIGISLENLTRWVRRQSFRAFVHDVPRIEARVAEAGFERVATARRFIWYVSVHRRPNSEAAAEGTVVA